MDAFLALDLDFLLVDVILDVQQIVDDRLVEEVVQKRCRGVVGAIHHQDGDLARFPFDVIVLLILGLDEALEELLEAEGRQAGKRLG